MNLTKLLGIFDILPGWLWAAILALVMLAAGLEFGALQARNAALRVDLALAQGKVATEVAGRAKDRLDFEQAKTVAVTAALVKAEQNARETERRLQAQQEITHDLAIQNARARADADRAAAAASGLHDQLSWFVAAAKRRAASDPAAAGGSTATGAALDLLAQLQRRIDEAAGGIAGFADRSHIAGLGCERTYDSVRPASSGKTP